MQVNLTIYWTNWCKIFPSLGNHLKQFFQAIQDIDAAN